MTDRRNGSDSKLSPAAAKVMLTLAAVAGTLGGWAVLAGAERPSGSLEVAEAPPAASDEGLPTLVEVAGDSTSATTNPPAQGPSRAAALRVVSQPPPRPITYTRSSR